MATTTPNQSPAHAALISPPAGSVVTILPNVQAHIEISGLLHKKRGGFGKMFTANPWQQRFFTISMDGYLCYFDTDSLLELGMTNRGEFDNSKARGKLDLKSSQFRLIVDQIEGAPFNFCIQLLFPNNTEEKWLLCAETEDDHGRWRRVLEKYLVKTLGNIPSAVSTTTISSETNQITPKQSLIPRNRSSSNIAPAVFDPPSYSQNEVSSPQPTNKAIPAVPIPAVPIPTVPIPTVPVPTPVPSQISQKVKGKRRLKLSASATLVDPDLAEIAVVAMIFNLCFLVVFSSESFLQKAFYITVANVVVLRTLNLRAARVRQVSAKLESLIEEQQETSVGAAAATSLLLASPVVPSSTDNRQQDVQQPSGIPGSEALSLSETTTVTDISTPRGKPTPGFTFTKVTTDPRVSEPHTWCQVDPRQFNVRAGPDYNKFKKKAPSGPPIYEAFAVDVFCTKLRVDNAATRFQLPDTSNINTHNQWVPPIFVIQIQIPSEPPTSLFSTVQDGPGWAIVMYYRVTEDTCNQLKDLSTASPAVKLFAEWCEKVINSCTNLEELGITGVFANYNAKPVLIRRTGSIFRGPNYMEVDIHVHKFDNFAKKSIHYISSRCGLMYMQIGFVIEGRENKELPETLFACVAVNKPQEEQAEFIFDE
eukprot:gene33305-43061_t